MRITADLANKKKHGRSENRSKLNPQLDLVSFDFSNCGPIEVYYDGAMKDKEIIATNPAPVSFTVDVLGQNDVMLGDARETINNTLLDWLPVIQRLDVLAANDREAQALCTILFDANATG